ncbi:MAG: TonB-dependent receptor [Taibaiella sp.]|nr:TonB-dependent receptor [Taibaiella sp.]
MVRVSGSAAVLFFLAVGNVGAQVVQKTDTSKVKALKEVSIKAQKSVTETAPGKTIVNVQSMAGNTGKNLLDLLRRMPGITVDAQGNISMAGKQGVLVTIDGRQTYLGGEDLTSYMQSITAEDVAQVELITQPAAHFDAEGNSGIVNIKLRKIKKRGFNGIATTAHTFSKLYGNFNTLLLNYRVNKLNYYASINYQDAAGTVDWTNDMKFTGASGEILSRSAMHSVPVEKFEKWNLRGGADYSYDINTTMGIGVTGAYYTNKMHSVINTTNEDIAGGTTLMTRNTNEASLRRNGAVNAYLKHAFSKQAELNISLDYLLFTRKMSQHLATDATKDGQQLPGQLALRSQLPINIQIWSGKADYSLALANGLKIESGAKFSHVAVDNSGLYETYINGSWLYDSSRTNHFLYDENISALYINATRRLRNTGRWEGQLGLRGELAQLRGMQQATKEEFTRRMPALFPTAYLSYKADSNNSFELSYGRRVERPHYSMLNPFNYYTFYNTYQKGNPGLLPQYSHDVQLKHTYKDKLTTTLDVSAVTDNLSNVVVADAATQTTYGIPVNFGTTKMASLSVGYNGKPYPWWDLVVTVQGMYSSQSGLINNNPVANAAPAAAVWLNNQFTAGKWTVDCWVNYNSTAVSSPVSRDRQNLFLSFGALRKWWHDTLTAKLATDDPFYSYRNASESAQPGLYSRSTLKPNSRTATLSLTWSFGARAENNTARESNGPEEVKRL